MTQAFYLDIGNIAANEALFSLLPPERQARCRQAVRSQKARGLAMAWLLLQYALRQFGQQPDVVCSAGGKPRLRNGGMFFNLSHCDKYAACMVSDRCEVGVDVERIRQIPAMFYRPYLHEEDFRLAVQTDSPAAWCQIWTRKEAVIKCMGDGWTPQTKKHLRVLPLPARYSLAQIWLDTFYHISACADAPDETIVFTEVDWNGCEITGAASSGAGHGVAADASPLL